jgi:hypothetical protein
LSIPARSTTAFTARRFSDRSLATVLVAAGAFVCTYAVTSPDGRLLKFLWLLAALAAGLALTPQAFIAVSVIAFAISTAFASTVVPSLSVPIYFSDLMVLVVGLRGLLPRARYPARAALSGAPALFFAAWCGVMALAAVRANTAGVGIASAVRGDLALVYWPLLYFGLTRTLRERALDVSALWRNLAIATLGLAAWMFLARAINLPFHDPGAALVATGDTTSVQRNFGFAGAFIVYPALALVGIAGLAYGEHERRGSRAALVAFVGTLATLFTLVRGEIFSLAFASVVMFWLRPKRVGTSARARTAVQVGFAVAAAVIGLVIANPTLGNAIVQRAVPFTHQAAGATANAEYRQKAVATGFRVARSHPLGLGVLNVTRLDAYGIVRGYLAHSGVATLLLFGGWPALGLALLTIFALIRRSFQIAAATPWLHPAFVAVVLMLSVYSISAAGLAGDPWVIPLGALAVALRFTLQQPRAEADT